LDHQKTILIWEVNHPMVESPRIECPVCTHEAVRLISSPGSFYFRGYGYLDKTGCKRDMELHKLCKDDPYGYMRQPGEADDLADKFRGYGKFNPNRKYYIPKKGGGGYISKE